MFSKSFMKFLLAYGHQKNQQEDPCVKEIQFHSVKVKEAAKVVITSIKDVC